MYKNFNVTEEERKQIMEMHQSYGYKKPLDEQVKEIPKPTTSKFAPPQISNEPEVYKPEPEPEGDEAVELNAFNAKILALKNAGKMSPYQFMLQYNKANPSRPIKTANDKIVPYDTKGATSSTPAPLDEGAPEPVRGERQMFGMFSFGEGETKPRYYRGRPIAQKDIDVMVNNLAQFLTNTGTVETLRTFRNSPRFRIPQFIELHVGTSHSGSGETNAAVAQGRFNFLTGIVMAAFKKIGVDASVAKSVVVNKTDNEYAPSNLDRNFYDPKLVKPSATERLAWITVTALETEGNTMGGLMAIQKGLNQSSSIVNSLFVDGVDETKILQYLSKLKTFSDVEELDRLINSGGTRFDSLEEFLNDQLFDDPEQMRAAAVILQRCAMKSELQKDTVRLFKAGGNLNISIGIGQ